MSKYNKTTALILCVLFGWLGVHHFYVKRNKMGILYLLTLGLWGFGWLIDILLVVTNKYKDSDGVYLTPPQNTQTPKYAPTQPQSTAGKYQVKANTSIPEKRDFADSTESIKQPAQPAAEKYQVKTNTPAPESKDFSDNAEPVKQSEITVPSKIDGLPLAYKYTDVGVCVISGEEPDYNAIIEKMSIEPVVTTLEIEADNPYDKKAIKVMYNGSKLGYLYKGKLKDMAYDYLREGRPIFSCLSSIDLDTYKMKMFMGFYYRKSCPNSVTFKLTSNSNAEMQEALALSSEGDELSLHYDFEKEKYCFSSIDDIGYAPKSKNDLLEEIEYDCIAVIDEINEDENGKLSVTVTVEYN